jgi:hypothetical protein
VGVPQKILEDVGQALRAAAEQPDGVDVAGVQMAWLQARIRAGKRLMKLRWIH